MLYNQDYICYAGIKLILQIPAGINTAWNSFSYEKRKN